MSPTLKRICSLASDGYEWRSLAEEDLNRMAMPVWKNVLKNNSKGYSFQDRYNKKSDQPDQQIVKKGKSHEN